MADDAFGDDAGFQSFFEDPLTLCTSLYRVDLADARSPTVATFMLCAWRLLEYFRLYPTLESVALTLVTTVQTRQLGATGHAAQVLVSRHGKVQAVGADLGMATPEAHGDFVRTHLPFALLDCGHFALSRDDASVRTYLAAPFTDRAAREQPVLETAHALHASFAALEVIHGASAMQ